MLKIEGERITLRDHEAGDLEAFHAWMADPVVGCYLAWRGATREEARIRLADAVREAGREPRTHYYMAMVRREDARIIGEAGFTVERTPEGGPVNGGIADMGWFLLRPYWGQGYASEAARLMIAYGFGALKLHKVTAGCDAENVASERVMRRCGMGREAYRRKDRLLDGTWRDRVEYALLYEDWAQCKPV